MDVMDQPEEPTHPFGSVDDEDDLPVPAYSSHGQGAWHLGGFGQSPVLAEPTESTPLDSAQPDPTVPSAPLWSMKYLRHAGSDFSSHDGERPVRWASAVDDGEDAIFVIDDGRDHCMVARLVGASPDGCTYCLVARVRRQEFEDVRAGWSPPAELFLPGKGFTLCGVAVGAVSNVFRVARYRKYKDVPTDYLPPADFIDFDELL
jgi:hypothetical protein